MIIDISVKSIIHDTSWYYTGSYFTGKGRDLQGNIIDGKIIKQVSTNGQSGGLGNGTISFDRAVNCIFLDTYGYNNINQYSMTINGKYIKDDQMKDLVIDIDLKSLSRSLIRDSDNLIYCIDTSYYDVINNVFKPLNILNNDIKDIILSNGFLIDEINDTINVNGNDVKLLDKFENFKIITMR